MSQFRRRPFLFLIASGTLLGLPISAIAQSGGKIHRVALIFTTSPVSVMLGPDPSQPHARAFLHALRVLGYVEGRNLMYEPRSAEGKFDRLPAIVAELVRLKVDVIVTIGNEIPIQAKKVTTTVPIVSWGLSNPVEIGLVQSLARPGGNVTGLTVSADAGAEAKRMQLLKEAVPSISRVVFLGTTRDWEGPSAEAIRAAARSLNVTIGFGEITASGYAQTFETMSRDRPDALFVAANPENFGHRRAIVDFATKARLPATFAAREFVEVGGLMFYGQTPDERARRAAAYVDRILRGAKAADLPIEQPTNHELVINLKTAKSLSIDIPQSILVRADRVIE